MSNLTRWNPFRAGFRLDPVPDIDDFFRGVALRPLLRDFDAAMTEMRLDVQEDDASYRITAELPGVRKEDIQVTAEGNQVTIEAEVKHEESSKERKQVHTERYFGKTYRSFSLPKPIDGTKCTASYDSGVLTLTLPKKNDGTSTRIAI